METRVVVVVLERDRALRAGVLQHGVRRRNLQTTKTIRRAVRPKDCSKTQFSVFARRAVNRYVVGMLMQCVKQVG